MRLLPMQNLQHLKRLRPLRQIRRPSQVRRLMSQLQFQMCLRRLRQIRQPSQVRRLTNLLQRPPHLPLKLRRNLLMVGRASLVQDALLRLRALLVRRSISLQRHVQRPPLDVLRFLLECHQQGRLLACRRARVHLLVALRFRHLQALCHQQVSASRRLLVSAWHQALHVLVLVVSVLVLVAALVVLAFALDLVAHAPAVLVVSVLVLVVRVLVVLVVPVLVLVLVLVLVDLVAHAPVVPELVLPARAVLVAVHVLVAALAVPVVLATDSAVHLARSHVHVAGASSTNCSRSSRSTRTAMLQYPKEQSSSSVVGQHRSSLQN
jgi:hypothetical protein